MREGERVGGYTIVALLGAGGMGEVYRARDAALARDVAIKVLSPLFTGDAKRRERFEREARVLAALSHPNIAQIYGTVEGASGGAASTLALVLELVEGETLADRIAPGPIPIDEALTVARQIAEALEAAHESGIVHRDLKPANIKIRPDGVVKVLDFGLAKSTRPLEAGYDGSDLSQFPTLTIGGTAEGVLLGTAAYMSPEQARGQRVDARTDIWSFGCVVFEMLTGRMVFAGDTAFDLVAAMLTRDPDWTALPADVPDPVRRLLHRCLQREPRRRLRDIGDARLELDDALNASAAPARRGDLSARARPATFQRLTDRLDMNESPAISPDGRMVAFVAPVGGRRQIWIRMLSGGAPLQVTHDDVDHERPRWTDHGGKIIYFVKSDRPGELGTVMEVAALGGPARPLATALNGADVSHDGRRLALFETRDGMTELKIVSRESGRVEHVAIGPPGTNCLCPRWSPDDQWLAFQTEVIGGFAHALFVVPASGAREPQLVARAASLRGLSWLPDGSGLVYSSSAGSTIPYPPTFNLRRVGRNATGDTALTFGDMSYVEPDVHASGTILACRIRGQSDIWRFPFGGSPAENMRGAVRITRQSGQVQVPSVSPDGREVVYLSDSGGHGNLWIARTDGAGVARQITFEQDPAITIGVPQWSPVDNRITFVSSREEIAIHMVNSDGRGLRPIIPRGQAASWSPDGAWIYYTAISDNDGWRIVKIPSGGGSPVLVRSDDSHAPSAGGSVLYYASRVHPTAGSLDWEYRRASPEDGPSEPLARVAGARIPVWGLFAPMALSRDGRWLARPLIDGATCNVFVLSVDGGSFTPVTDFGDRPTMIARQVSWGPDGSIYAAVAEITGDIVLLDGLV